MTNALYTECIVQKGKRIGNHVDSGIPGDRLSRGDRGGCAAGIWFWGRPMSAAAAWSVFYRFSTLFAMEPWLRGLNPSLYYTVNRLVQFWM